MKLVFKFKQSGAYAVRYPICAGQELTQNEARHVIKECTSYGKLVGSLL